MLLLAKGSLIRSKIFLALATFNSIGAVILIYKGPGSSYLLNEDAQLLIDSAIQALGGRFNVLLLSLLAILIGAWVASYIVIRSAYKVGLAQGDFVKMNFIHLFLTVSSGVAIFNYIWSETGRFFSTICLTPMTSALDLSVFFLAYIIIMALQTWLMWLLFHYYRQGCIDACQKLKAAQRL